MNNISPWDQQNLCNEDLNEHATAMIDFLISQGGYVGDLLSAQRIYIENLKTATALYIYQQKMNLRAELQNEFDAIKNENETLKIERETLKNAIRLLEKEAYDLCRVNIEHETTVENYRQQIARLSHDLSQSQKLRSSMNAERSSSKLAAIEEDAGILLEKLRVFQSLLKKKQQQNGSMWNEIKELKSTRDILTSVSNVQKSCITELTKENSALKAKLNEFMTSGNGLLPVSSAGKRRHVETTENESDYQLLQEKINHLESTLKSLQDEKNEMQDEMKKTENAFDLLKTQVDSTVCEIQKKDAELLLLKAEIRRLNSVVENCNFVDLPNSSDSSEYEN